MKTNHKIHLRRKDIIDKKFLIFLFPKHELEKKFRVSKGGIAFDIGLGLIEDLQEVYPYTDIEFETELETNLTLFEEGIPLIVDSENLKMELAERIQLKEATEAERINLETQLQALFPIVLEAFNIFRSACKVALYKESIAGRLLTRNIQDSQIHRGEDPSRFLEDYFSGDDTAFLFDAFSDLSLSSFTGEADIEYRVRNEENNVCEGVFNNGYKRLHSPSRFFHRLDDIGLTQGA